MNVTEHTCDTPGLTMGEAKLEPVISLGREGWKATAPIGTIFGAEVHGELTGYGPTKEAALQRLHEERLKLHDSIWD